MKRTDRAPWSDPNKGRWTSDNQLMKMHPDKGCKYSKLCIDCPFEEGCLEEFKPSIQRQMIAQLGIKPLQDALQSNSRRVARRVNTIL